VPEDHDSFSVWCAIRKTRPDLPAINQIGFISSRSLALIELVNPLASEPNFHVPDIMRKRENLPSCGSARRSGQ
jgi:hypothetical protein